MSDFKFYASNDVPEHTLLSVIKRLSRRVRDYTLDASGGRTILVTAANPVEEALFAQAVREAGLSVGDAPNSDPDITDILAENVSTIISKLSAMQISNSLVQQLIYAEERGRKRATLIRALQAMCA
jgi:hypothetical protein